jgi:hypothetical protein
MTFPPVPAQPADRVAIIASNSMAIATVTSATQLCGAWNRRWMLPRARAMVVSTASGSIPSASLTNHHPHRRRKRTWPGQNSAGHGRSTATLPYTLTIHNLGTLAATAVFLTDTLPALSFCSR